MQIAKCNFATLKCDNISDLLSAGALMGEYAWGTAGNCFNLFNTWQSNAITLRVVNIYVDVFFAI